MRGRTMARAPYRDTRPGTWDRPRAARARRRVSARKCSEGRGSDLGIRLARGVVMFDNLFGFAGPLGTAFALVGLLVSTVMFAMVANKVAQMSTGPSSRRARI